MRLWLPLLFTTLAWGDPLTQGERDRAMSYLHATQKQVTDTVSSLSPAQLAFRAAPDRWSVADCLEHLALTETALFEVLQDKVLKSPARPDLVAAAKGRDEAVMKQFSTRDQKFKAPEMLVPSHKWKTVAETLAAFRGARKKTIAYVESTPDELRLHFNTAQPPLDGYQVLLMIAAHSERHYAQMKEVIASPGFPRK